MKHYSDNEDVNLQLKNISLWKLSQDQAESLEVALSEKEVREAVYDCKGNKAPGPGGFNFNFIKAKWQLLKKEFLEFLEDFQKSCTFSRSVNASFLTLVRKREAAEDLGDYRLICLIRCIYKVLAKVLANRLKSVLQYVVSEHQTAFIKGRQILVSIIFAKEILDYMAKRREGGLVLKLDFEKAFDSVKWRFLDEVMKLIQWLFQHGNQ
ncbi:Cysteine-rich receptor-like protein kinase [Quillaja saponaria]|uniref:Cysteine-rich receptor-like protein kinase n=1 Tax=Quillaja saponaria TaxID=32244 RepID=A0AAD7L4E1_QUISA|nr:Cysteine-rich receptor-like protein kinase [Quillaja saponaria]